MSGNPERRLIGCILLAADEIVPTLRGVLTADHFTITDYRTIWLQACKLMDDGWPVDYRMVVAKLGTNRGVADLARVICGETAHSRNWRYYAYLMIEKYERAVVGAPDDEPLVPWINTRLLVQNKSKARLAIASRALQGSHSISR